MSYPFVPMAQNAKLITSLRLMWVFRPRGALSTANYLLTCTRLLLCQSLPKSMRSARCIQATEPREFVRHQCRCSGESLPCDPNQILLTGCNEPVSLGRRNKYQ